ncbi:MAG: putative glycoside hydrolase family 15 protein [Acidobacteria bacterium]|nr:putative glycoside hydrolase family 15 protein [Acidobacteriota bacterium]
MSVSATAAPQGRVNLIKRSAPAFDPYTNSPTSTLQQWMRDHFSRMIVFTPYFDDRSFWYPNGLVYIDAYAVYRDRFTLGYDVVGLHPEWIMRDPEGHPLYIPWGCEPVRNICPQYAADVSNPDFRAWWIDSARQQMAQGNYRGLWIDDVNMEWRVSDGQGRTVVPLDYTTGAPMIIDDWRRYMAEFMEKVRAEFPGVEIGHNAIWFAGDTARLDNPYVRRQIFAADYINIEHGVNDPNLQGGRGRFSYRSLLEYCDAINALGRRIVLDGIGGGGGDVQRGMEYAVASYLLFNDGDDALADGLLGLVTPDQWWPVLDSNLGNALAPRYDWSGVIRRDFTGGIALVNEPWAKPVTVQLDHAYRRPDGSYVRTVTLGPAQGAVLAN